MLSKGRWVSTYRASGAGGDCATVVLANATGGTCFAGSGTMGIGVLVGTGRASVAAAGRATGASTLILARVADGAV